MAHAAEKGLQWEATRRVGALLAQGDGPGKYKVTDIDLLKETDWEDAVELINHQFKSGRKHITASGVTTTDRYREYKPLTPVATEPSPVTASSVRRPINRETRTPIITASKRDFESTYQTRSAIMVAAQSYYSCPRRCNRGLYCLPDDRDLYIHYAMGEADLTSLVDLIAMASRRGELLTVEEPGSVWKQRVIREAAIKKAKKGGSVSASQTDYQPPPAPTYPQWYQQAPPWQQQPPPSYGYSQQAHPQPPPPQSASPARKSSPVSRDPDVDNLGFYCDWLGRKYRQYQAGIEEAKGKLLGDFYTIKSFHEMNDTEVRKLLQSSGLCQSLKRHIKEFQREQRAAAENEQVA